MNPHLETFPHNNEAGRESSPQESGQQIEADAEKQDEPLTAEKATKLFFLSYRFSQGDIISQKSIFRYLKATHPAWHIDNTLRDELEKKAKPIFIKYLRSAERAPRHVQASGEPLEEENIEKSVENESAMMQHVFSGEEEGEATEFTADEKSAEQIKKKAIREVATNIILRDWKYLEKNKGRSRPHTSDAQGRETTPLYDPFLSHLCYYGIEGRSAGMPEYDAMFQDVVTYLKGEFKDDPDKSLKDIKEKLDFVITAYNEKSKSKAPGTYVSL